VQSKKTNEEKETSSEEKETSLEVKETSSEEKEPSNEEKEPSNEEKEPTEGTESVEDVKPDENMEEEKEDNNNLSETKGDEANLVKTGDGDETTSSERDRSRDPKVSGLCFFINLLTMLQSLPKIFLRYCTRIPIFLPTKTF
jgi:hypothetical protein